MKKNIYKTVVALVLLCILVHSLSLPVQGAGAKAESEPESLQLYAQSAVLMDAGSGRILYEKNGFDPKPMASTTKIMTCILALEYGNLQDYVEVSSYAAGMPKVKLNIQAGERYLLKDLLYSLMLESHNDSAVAIAEHIGGSVEGFAEMMNQKARDIGCYDTFFITPNGLDATAEDKDGNTRVHSTTAADLARIMSYCIMDSPKKEEFLEITGTPSYQLIGYREQNGEIVPNGRNFSCSNHNVFLSMMDGAFSGKTGFTGNAGYCYVGALRRDDRTYVVALLACGWPNNKSYKWSDTKELMAYGIDNFTFQSLAGVKVEEDTLLPIPVTDGQTEQIGETAYVPVRIARKEGLSYEEGVLLKEGEALQAICEMEESLTAPVQEGTEVGCIRYQLGDEVYRVDYIVTAAEVEAIDFTWCFRQILSHYSI